MTTSVVTPVPDDFQVIDLGTPKEIVTDALKVITEQHGKMTGTSRTEVADVNRVLLHLADDLALAAALVRNAYWASRGEESYEL